MLGLVVQHVAALAQRFEVRGPVVWLAFAEFRFELAKATVAPNGTKGFMKAVVDAETHRILGAAILGTGGDEGIHGVLDVMNAGISYGTLQHAVPTHPTVSELIPTMLNEMRPATCGTKSDPEIGLMTCWSGLVHRGEGRHR